MTNISSAADGASIISEPETGQMEANSMSFLPVDSEEIAFALTVFVAAANRKLDYQTGCFSGLSPVSRRECEDLFVTLSVRDFARQPSSPMMAVMETSIQAAFMELWYHYRADDLRHSICARVLGFYYLMERTGGAGLDRWIDQCPDSPEAVLLHAEVVDAIASITLDNNGQVQEPLFYKAIEDMKRANAAPC